MTELKREVIELMLLFFLIFFGLCAVDSANRELIHEQAVHQAQFYCSDDIEDGFFIAMTTGGKERKYKPKYREKIYIKP